MSHVTTVDVQIGDLGALGAACKRVGLELVRDQKTYNWYGTHVGDTPIPEGFTEQDLGRCDHAIRLPGKPNAYEIGVVRARNGQPGYTLMIDEWVDGLGLVEKCGKGCGLLKQAYATEVAIAAAELEGFHVNELPQPDGSIQLQLTKP